MSVNGKTGTAQGGWHFGEKHRGDVMSDPVESQFFRKQGLANALVRESVQNSLDRRRKDHVGPVKVVFTFSSAAHGLNGATANHYLGKLMPHVAIATRVALPEPVKYLVVEDFGTTGLQGDPMYDDVDAPESNDFYYFWRNIGRSSKRESDRGRWGLGKTVFVESSAIRAFFGLTIRADDHQRLLMGQSVLNYHKIGATGFVPYGYYGLFPNGNFAEPISEKEFLDTFCGDFGLKRTVESGLSVVVLCPKEGSDDELTPKSVLKASVQHFFYPVLDGSLVVDITGADGTVTLNTANIAGLAASIDWNDEGDEILRAIDLAAWAIKVQDEDRVLLPALAEGCTPDWTNYPFNPTDMENLRERFGIGERVAIRVPVSVRRKSDAPKISSFDLYLERDDELPKGYVCFIRQGITLPEVKGRQSRVRALVVAQHGPLATLLGDSEGPAHESWQERQPKIREGYVGGASVIRFVLKSLRALTELLVTNEEEEDPEALAGVFYIPEDDGGSTKKATRKKKKPVGLPPIVLPPEPKPRSYRLEREQGGFRITGTGAGDTPVAIRIRAAYDVHQGDPFKRYNELDFDLFKSVRKTGARCTRIAGNSMRIEVLDPKFSVIVSGFDQNRDLVVDASAERKEGEA